MCIIPHGFDSLTKSFIETEKAITNYSIAIMEEPDENQIKKHIYFNRDIVPNKKRRFGNK